MSRLSGLFLVLLAAFPAAVAAEIGSPRRLSAAERQAVVLAAEYLSFGPEAWWSRLSESSPLRLLGRDLAVKAIEVRAGPPAGAHWHLQTASAELTADSAVFTVEFPSGLDETLTLILRHEDGAWRLHSVRMSAEPLGGFAASTVKPVGRAGGSPQNQSALLPVLAASSLALMAVARRRRSHRTRWQVLIAVPAALVLACRWSSSPRSDTPEAVSEALIGGVETEIASLLELRRALAKPQGTDLARSGASVREGVSAWVAKAWKAQALLSELRIPEAAEILETARVSDNGQIKLARARLSRSREHSVDTRTAYESALAVLPRHDGLLLEAARAFEVLGLEEATADVYAELAASGSRQAQVHYHLARRALQQDRRFRAAKHFETAWRLRPLRRAEVLQHPMWVELIETMPELKLLLRLDSAAGPRVACAGVADPISVPADLTARRLGGLLVLDTAESWLEVPGGCRLAPSGTKIDSAESWQKWRDLQLFVRMPTLVQTTSSQGRSRPRAWMPVAETVAALAREGRWQTVVDLTGSLPRDLQLVPRSLIRQRAEGLHRTGRTELAIELLNTVAGIDARHRRIDVDTLRQLAELLAARQEYDRAIALMAKVDAVLSSEQSYQRLFRLRIERRLIESAATYDSPHFQIYYPRERSYSFAKAVADALEGERRRLGRWIPVEVDQVTKVLLLEGTGSRPGCDLRLGGLYHGRIRLAFGDALSLNPRLVSLLSHELAHSMVAEATHDQAPFWLQEGLARHVEAVQPRINPVPALAREGHLLAFPLIEVVLASPAVSQLSPIAQEEALWTAHFIESELGVGAIRRLLRSFRAGATSEQAIHEVFGASVTEFDGALWRWCLEEAPEIWTRRAD